MDTLQVFKDLLIKGKTDGFLLVDDLNLAFADDAFEGSEIDNFLNILNEMKVPIYESNPDTEETDEFDGNTGINVHTQQEPRRRVFDQKHTEQRWAFLNHKMSQEGLNEAEKREWQQLFTV